MADVPVRLDELDSGATVVVDYWADWWGLRKRFTSAFERLCPFEGRLRFVKLAVGTNPHMPRNNGACGIPATRAPCRGQAGALIVGSVSTDCVHTQLEQQLQAA